VLRDVDVVVAGSGLCGTFAAIASGRCGASTLLVERYGTLGGNIGPGMIVNGSLYGEAGTTLPGGLSGIPGEFMDRLDALRSRHDRHYPEESAIVCFLAWEMMQECGVEVLLSMHVSGPITDGGTVRGVFVETPSGRAAVTATVTVDGTGSASLASRAGSEMVPFLEAKEEYSDYIRPAYLKHEHPRHYNDTQLLCVVAGVDLARYARFEESGEELDGRGSFACTLDVEPGVRIAVGRKPRDFGDGNVGLHITCSGAVNAGDLLQTSRLEGAIRAHAFRMVAHFREHIPGFERAYLLATPSFLGWRGGPHIVGERVLKLRESFEGRKCDDVLYRNVHEHNHGGEASGFDVPYGIVLPRGIDGLLVCGRGAAYLRRGHEPTGMRSRPSMMVLGQCVGTAAAVAALDGVLPKDLDIRKAQRRLVADGICLGDADRLRALGIPEA